MTVDTERLIHGFVTKYSLTLGILEVTATQSICDDHKWFSVRGYQGWFRKGDDFFLSRVDAEQKARLMARRKVLALRKRLNKMDALEKTPKWATKPILPTPGSSWRGCKEDKA